MAGLFEHTADSLIPLVRTHLPASIFVYGALVTPPAPEPYISTSRAYSTIPILADGSPVGTDAEGAILVSLTTPSGTQIRIFDTLESAVWRGELITDEALNEGRRRVIEAVKMLYEANIGLLDKLGGVHELWAGALAEELGNGAQVAPLSVWLPPSESIPEQSREVVGYELDIGRPEDIAMFSSGSDIPRDPAYYLSRLPWSTVIRPTVSSAEHPRLPACRILAHADGSIGTLSTHPEHLRKGLAQWIVREHIASGRGVIGGGDKAEGGLEGRRWSFAVVFERNTPSKKMFERMGWKRAWGCAWIIIDLSQEGEEGRNRAKEAEGVKRMLEGSELAERNTLGGRR